jgi:cation:H+ antiporter
MLYLWVDLIFMLIIILISSQLFTNALEHLGEKIGISTGITGSIFAAVATALPEASVPIIALVAGTADKAANQEISVGAILGAPLMISTLSIFIMTISVIKQRGIRGRICPEKTGFVRDLNFFIMAFFLSALAMYVPLEPIYFRTGISLILIGTYIIYIVFTCLASKELVANGHGVRPEEPIMLTKIGFKKNAVTIYIQLLLALVLLLCGAKGFINGVENISKSLHFSVLLLSLLIIPFATELPEKVNSIFWVRKNKDTLGFGNLTGAMVFQGTLLPALGILLTPWQPSRIVQAGIFITFAAAIWLRLNASSTGLRIKMLMVNGALYLLYLYLVLIQ